MSTEKTPSESERKEKILLKISQTLDKHAKTDYDLVMFLHAISSFFEFFNGQRYLRHGFSNKYQDIRKGINSAESLNFFTELEGTYTDTVILGAQNSHALRLWEDMDEDLDKITDSL